MPLTDTDGLLNGAIAWELVIAFDRDVLLPLATVVMARPSRASRLPCVTLAPTSRLLALRPTPMRQVSFLFTRCAFLSGQGPSVKFQLWSRRSQPLSRQRFRLIVGTC